MGLKETIKEGERLTMYVPKFRYKCPFCSKRFKSIPQRTIHSPFPTCPRCGVPVSEEHRVPAFDRTRKVLKVLLFPLLLPVKLSVLTAILSWKGTKASTMGIWRGAMFMLLLPLNIVKEYRKKRFASPEVLQAYLREVQNQWKNPNLVAPEKKIEKISLVDAPKGDPDEVMLSEKGRLTYTDDSRNPHGIVGKVVNCMQGTGGRQWFIKWTTGKVGGPYSDEDILFINT